MPTLQATPEQEKEIREALGFLLDRATLNRDMMRRTPAPIEGLSLAKDLTERADALGSLPGVDSAELAVCAALRELPEQVAAPDFHEVAAKLDRLIEALQQALTPGA